MQHHVSAPYVCLSLWDQHELARATARSLFGRSYQVRRQCVRGKWKAAAVKISIRADECKIEIVRNPNILGRMPDYTLVWNIHTEAYKLTYMDYSRPANGTCHVLEQQHEAEMIYRVTEQGYQAPPVKAGSYMNMKKLVNAMICQMRRTKIIGSMISL